MIEKIRLAAAENPNIIIAIDGMAAAGKSTLARRLADELGAEIVHMDDFFLPAGLRTAERLSQPGGNVHYERFEAEVAANLRRRNEFCYGVFDCGRMAVTESRRISCKGPVIVEGAYALRPEFRNLYDIKIFMTVDQKTQMERIIKRSGPEKAEMFRNKWIPLEAAYFEAFDVKAAADTVI